MTKFFRTLFSLFLCVGLAITSVRAKANPSAGPSALSVLGWGGVGTGLLAAIAWGVNNHQLNMLKRRRRALHNLQDSFNGVDPTSQSHKVLANRDINRLDRQIKQVEKREAIIASTVGGLGVIGIASLVGAALSGNSVQAAQATHGPGLIVSPSDPILPVPKPVDHGPVDHGPVVGGATQVRQHTLATFDDINSRIACLLKDQGANQLGDVWQQFGFDKLLVPAKSAQIHPSPPDGDCLFHTIVAHLSAEEQNRLGIDRKTIDGHLTPLSQDRDAIFRRAVVAEVMQMINGDKPEAENMLNEIVADYGRVKGDRATKEEINAALAAYQAVMANSGAWAGYAEITAAVALVKRPLIIWKQANDLEGNPYWYIHAIRGTAFAAQWPDPKDWMNARYSGDHYDVLVPSSDELPLPLPEPAPSVPIRSQAPASQPAQPKPASTSPEPPVGPSAEPSLNPARPHSTQPPKPMKPAGASPGAPVGPKTKLLRKPTGPKSQPAQPKPALKSPVQPEPVALSPRPAPAPVAPKPKSGRPALPDTKAKPVAPRSTRGGVPEPVSPVGVAMSRNVGLLGSGRLSIDESKGGRPIDRHFLNEEEFPQRPQDDWSKQPGISLFPQNHALSELNKGSVVSGLHFTINNGQFGKVKADGSCGWYACCYEPGKKLADAGEYRRYIRGDSPDTSPEMDRDTDLPKIHKDLQRNIFILEPVGWDEHGDMVVKLDGSHFDFAYASNEPLYLLHMKQDVGRDRDYRVGVHYDLFRPKGGFATQRYEIGSSDYDSQFSCLPPGDAQAAA